MLILLPPSERKNTRTRGRPARFDSLSFPVLDDTRARVRTELAAVSSEPEAWSRLGLSAGLADEIAHNTRLGTAAALPAEELYAGVLYDALGLADLPAPALRRARAAIVVTSALFGALRLRDRVPPYRLSAGTALPGLPPLAGLWRPELDPVLSEAAGRGPILDCRSAGYMAMWTPSKSLAPHRVHVVVPGASHMAKKIRGEVARAVCLAPRAPRSVQGLYETVRDGLADTHETDLAEPVSGTKPWRLSVRPRD